MNDDAPIKRTGSPEGVTESLDRLIAALSALSGVEAVASGPMLILEPDDAIRHGNAVAYTADENNLPASMSDAEKARACASAAEAGDSTASRTYFRRLSSRYRNRVVRRLRHPVTMRST